MHYCDFCGKQLYTSAKYCRYCGRLLPDKINDTQPLPIINDTILINNQTRKYFSCSDNFWLRQIRKLKLKKYALFSYLAALITTVGLIYVLATFKTVDEYQLLTGAVGILLILYFWRSAQQ